MSCLNIWFSNAGLTFNSYTKGMLESTRDGNGIQEGIWSQAWVVSVHGFTYTKRTRNFITMCLGRIKTVSCLVTAFLPHDLLGLPVQNWTLSTRVCPR